MLLPEVLEKLAHLVAGWIFALFVNFAAGAVSIMTLGVSRQKSLDDVLEGWVKVIGPSVL